MDGSMIKKEILQSSVADEMVHDLVDSDWTDSAPYSSGTNHEDVTELKHEYLMDNSAKLGMNDGIENEKMGNSFIEPSSRMISNLIVIAPQDDNFDKCKLFQTNTGPYSPCRQGVINQETTTPAMEQEIMDVVIKEEITQDVSKKEIDDRWEIQNCKEYVKLGDDTDFSCDDKLEETVKTEAQPDIMKNKMSEDRLQKLIIKSESILEENTQPGLHTSDLPNLLPEGMGIIQTDTGVWSTRFLPKGTEFSLYDHSAFSSHNFAAGHQQLDLQSSLRKSSEGYNVVAEKWGSKIIYKVVTDIQPQTELILLELKPTSNIDEMDTSCQEIETFVMIKHSAPKPHLCIECGKTFTQKGRLVKHMLTHSGERPHECIECGKTFKRKQHLVTHMLTHLGERSHECKKCAKFFFRADILKQHMLTHSGDKPHQCKQCGKFFSRSGHLKQHMLTHSGDKPHECKQCGKLFSQSGSLNVHMKSHTKERPFQCIECGLQFTLKQSLATHMLTHSDDKPHGCKQCGKFFSHPGSLSRHMKSHKEEKSH